MEGLLWLEPLISGVGRLWEDCQEFLPTPRFLRGRGLSLRVLCSGGGHLRASHGATSEHPLEPPPSIPWAQQAAPSKRLPGEVTSDCVVLRCRMKSGNKEGGSEWCRLFKEEKLSSGEPLEPWVIGAALHSSEIILRTCIFSAAQSIFVPL